MSKPGPSAVVPILVALGGALSASAQEIPPAAPGARGGTTAVVVAGRRYAAGPLQRWFLGSTYRTVWTTPVRVDVLDLSTLGGLTPVKKGGGKQTKSLRFETPDGRRFRVRSVDKDPDLALPENLRHTVAEDLAQDQISAEHPAGALVVDGLAEAAGVLHVDHKLVVVPDDARLGPFRKSFAGMLGLMEQEVSDKGPAPPGLEGLRKAESQLHVFKLLDAGPPDRIDTRAYLKARLLDDLVGDWDRHEEQWDWVLLEGNPLWQPVPLDRDQAFTKYDGAAVAVLRPGNGQLLDFGPRYSNVVGLNWNATVLDRRLLMGIEWPVWEAVVKELQAALPDPVVEQAVHRMPTEYYMVSGHPMIRRLEARRDALLPLARRFYEMLARDVEAWGTGKPDLAEVVRAEDGSVTVRLSLLADGTGPDGAPYFTRRLLPGETQEVRIYLQDGNDRAVARGPESSIRVRVIGGGGDDVVEDTAGGGVRVYDAEGTNRFEGVRHVDDRPFKTPHDEYGGPLRDWGRSVGPSPWLAAGGDLGFFVGAQVAYTDYGFRKYPYHTRHALGVGWASGLGGIRAEYRGDVLAADSPRRFGALLSYSEVGIVRFHGFGNETAAPLAREFYHVPQKQLEAALTQRFLLRGVDFAIGPVVKYTRTDLQPGHLITLARPYGSQPFGQAGLVSALVVDRRDHAGAPSKGVLLDAGGAFYPAVWSAVRAFGEAHGALSTYLSAPGARRATLALRVGGKKVFGEHPFHEAAFVGGPDVLLGLPRQRYAGDAAAWGNAELRLALVRARVLVPTDFGVFGLADGGRVFLDGETSREWHTGFGGGLWASFLKPENTVTLAAARSEGSLRVSLTGGFRF